MQKVAWNAWLISWEHRWMQGIPISNIKETKGIVVQQQFDPSMGGSQVGCHGTKDYTIE